MKKFDKVFNVICVVIIIALIMVIGVMYRDYNNLKSNYDALTTKYNKTVDICNERTELLNEVAEENLKAYEAIENSYAFNKDGDKEVSIVLTTSEGVKHIGFQVENPFDKYEENKSVFDKLFN